MGNVYRIFNYHPRVSVNPGPGIPARSRLGYIVCTNNKHVSFIFTKKDMFSHVIFKRSISIRLNSKQFTVDIDFAVWHHSVELNQNFLHFSDAGTEKSFYTNHPRRADNRLRVRFCCIYCSVLQCSSRVAHQVYAILSHQKMDQPTLEKCLF